MANHFSAHLGPFRMVWERHTEFARYTFIAPSAGNDPFAKPAISLVPAKWIATRPGEIIEAAHAALIPGDHPLDLDDVSARLFPGQWSG